ncbi:acyl-coenzyme A thioesterase 3-like [Sphaeramia orbicularis]|uniref:acyl-coenzyme A thioesterase 3-like n=1 Tax=Sphaeramia orbicularis TaxID=375764 RepID=UPI00117F3A01|nr:acyl-coenzyme A thioesterase 3-like [Sphaeramia orbicularis]
MDSERCNVKLSVYPSRGLVDEKFTVLVQKAPPGFQMTIHALHQSEDGNSLEAFAHYTADACGTINLSEDPSMGGTYVGVEPMGLLWSLKPAPGSKPGIRLSKKNVQTPMEFTISVYKGHQTEGFVDQVQLACVVVERWYMAPGVRRVPITEGGLIGVLFLPPGSGPFPRVLDLWGGGVDLLETRSALLASHGFASMTINYMDPFRKKAETTEAGKIVNNQYFETALRVLQQHPQILSSSIGMLGLSFGASVTFKMAAYSDVVKLKCAVCISGSHVQPVDGSVADLIEYCTKNASKIRVNTDNQVITRDLLLPIPTDPTMKVDVGRVQCPLLLIVGEDDQNWPVSESAQDIKEMMERAGNSHLLTILSYPNTGHLINPPYSGHVLVSTVTYIVKPVISLWGGEMVAHCRAQEDAWRKILVFLMENLFVHNSANTSE